MEKSDQQLWCEQRIILLRLVLGDSMFHYMVRSLQQDPRTSAAHNVDIVVRKDGMERRIEADWLKEIARIVADVEPPPL